MNAGDLRKRAEDSPGMTVGENVVAAGLCIPTLAVVK